MYMAIDPFKNFQEKFQEKFLIVIKFLRGPIFVVFTDDRLTVKIKPMK